MIDANAQMVAPGALVCGFEVEPVCDETRPSNRRLRTGRMGNSFSHCIFCGRCYFCGIFC